MFGIPTILKCILSLLAGVGVADMADRFLPGKVKGYEPISPGFRLGRKLLFFVGAMGAGALAWNFVNRKFHILTPRHAPRRRKSKKR